MTATCIETPSGEAAASDQGAAAFDAVVQALIAKRDAVLAEICAYPTPIPACDAHFNWLLEVRTTVFAEMRELFALQAGEPAAGALARFVRNAISLDSDTKSRLLGTAGPG
jgi:hypothetical protein